MGIIYEIYNKAIRTSYDDFSSICKKGYLGSYKQASAYMFGKLLTGKKHHHVPREWDEELNNITLKYKGVRIWQNIANVRIGEYLSRYLMILKNLEDCKDEYLNIMVSPPNFINKALEKIVGRFIPVVNDDNRNKWIYIVSKLQKKGMVDYTKSNLIYNRYDDKSVYASEWYRDKLSLSEEETQYCEKKMSEMRLKEPYVCIFNRDSAFLHEVDPKSDNSHHDYRDSSIETRYPLIDYLNENGIQSVRVGKVAIERCSYGGCIDYTFDYRDELMDFFLHSRAKFVVGDTNGLILIPLINNGHVVYTNLTPVFGGWCSLPTVFDGIVIFKKIFDTKKERFLTLEEMVEADKKAMFNGKKYKEIGLKHIENSPQEILDAAIEMNERIDGTWVESESDKLRQKKFEEFQKKMAEKYGYPEGDYFHARVGARFLEQNWDIFGL